MLDNACAGSNLFSGCQILVEDLAGKTEQLFMSMSIMILFLKKSHGGT
jgi:hypothetical protein